MRETTGFSSVCPKAVEPDLVSLGWDRRVAFGIKKSSEVLIWRFSDADCGDWDSQHWGGWGRASTPGSKLVHSPQSSSPLWVPCVTIQKAQKDCHKDWQTSGWPLLTRSSHEFMVNPIALFYPSHPCASFQPSYILSSWFLKHRLSWNSRSTSQVLGL